MIVSPSEPFQIVYSLFQHQFLGFLFESFVVQLDANRRLTLKYQNISSQNAAEFAGGLNETDYELIKLMDSIQQDAVTRQYSNKKMLPNAFFLKVYDAKTGDKVLQNTIHQSLERKRALILEKLKGKLLFEMGNDGNPTNKRIHIEKEKATVLFHFRRNEEDTHYFPTIKHKGEKLEFQYQNAMLICSKPAWLLLKGHLYHFEKEVDGHKLKPFLNKRFIAVPRKLEEDYYKKFVTSLIESFDVYAKGFEIKTIETELNPILYFYELAGSNGTSLFGGNRELESNIGKIVFELIFDYKGYRFKADNLSPVNVQLEKYEENYTFYRVKRNLLKEEGIQVSLITKGLPLKNGKVALEKTLAFQWLSEQQAWLKEEGITIHQQGKEEKRYFVGKTHINLEINENYDWFDINAKVTFGDFEIPFLKIRKLILSGKYEFTLPNGEIAVIPEAWFTQYGDLMYFIDEKADTLTLKKHHLSLVQELQTGGYAQVAMGRKLEQLRDFEQIEDSELPVHFKGELRPYQKAGFNWLMFLNQYRFGGCLADDMGLGKTVQTLALLQAQKENAEKNGETKPVSLLVMPTSLLYNWEMEANKFTPKLKILIYNKTNRIKNTAIFNYYDLVLTSYGIVRLDIEILKQFYFHYVILDESQAIKNPESAISQLVRELKSKFRLVLTGTPIENSTMDLWSQMSFVNGGLLGSQSFFQKEFLQPIEKNQDFAKLQKLQTIIKPFVLRRHKSQVAKDLPDKEEHIHYSEMSELQEKKYEEIKSHYRNQILDLIEKQGLAQSQLIVLQGLTKLRQVANHPRMIEEGYEGDSGKLRDVLHKLETALSEEHKVLIFSQFVKHLTIIRQELEKRNVRYAYLDGATKDRQEQVDLFQKNACIPVFLISLKAGGTGLNLTAADYVFLLDPWWNPAVEAQAIDRAHRIGQENKVLIYKFITKNTVEEKILLLQQSKTKLANELITTEESFIKQLTQADIEQLLM
jgi:SNF2 family DNA or RNA helicase